jgi:endonuclease YncB( thermonuclease family)
MKKILLFLVLTASLMAWEHGKVVVVIDGDTVMMKNSKGKVTKCRLVGLDTFETKVNHRTFKQLNTLKDIHPFKPHSVKEVLKWGYKAKEFVKSRTLHKEVLYHKYGLDQYGRELIYIKNINHLLIRYGLAVQYPTNLMHVERKKFLLEASREANKEKRGFYEKR